MKSQEKRANAALVTAKVEEEKDGGGSGGQTLAPHQRRRKLLSPPSCHGYSKEQLAACVIERKREREGGREAERENQ